MKKIKTLTVLLSFVGFFSCALAENTIDVATIDRPPFSFQNENETWSGFSIELLEEIATQENLDLVYQEQSVFKEMLEGVESGQFDIAAANISVTAQREALMDFSQPIYESGLQILLPADSAKPGLFHVVWESGILLFLAGALFVLLIVAHLVWFFERNTENPKHDYFRDDYFGGIWDAFWWAFIVVTMGGFENERPEHYIGRALAVFWVLTSLFFVSALTAQITTALTVAELSTNIESYEDLRGVRVGAAEGTTISNFLDKKNISYIPYQDFSLVLKDLESGVLDAAVGGAAVSQYYAATKGQGKVITAGPVFAPDSIAFAFPEDSPYFEQINQRLIKLQQDGTYQEIRQKYFGK